MYSTVGLVDLEQSNNRVSRGILSDFSTAIWQDGEKNVISHVFSRTIIQNKT